MTLCCDTSKSDILERSTLDMGPKLMDELLTSSFDSGFLDHEETEKSQIMKATSQRLQQMSRTSDGLDVDESRKFPWDTTGADLFILVDEEIFPVHREVVFPKSKVFESFVASINELSPVITLRGYDPEDIFQLLENIYNDPVDLEDENVVGLLNVADEFMVENVLARCERHLLETDCFTALELLELAVKYNLEKLRQEASLRVSMIPGIEYSNEFETMGVEEQNLVLRHLVQRQRRKLDLLEDIAAKRCPYHQFSSSCSKCCFKVVY